MCSAKNMETPIFISEPKSIVCSFSFKNSLAFEFDGFLNGSEGMLQEKINKNNIRKKETEN